MPTIVVNDIRLDYTDQGKGAVVILLHGLGSTKADWDEITPALENHFRVIAVDMRGHGESGKPKSAYGVELMASDIHQLMTQLQIKKASLVGFSMGGAVAFEFAFQYPEMANKLLILNSGPDFNDMGEFGAELLRVRNHELQHVGLPSLAKDISYRMFPEDHQLEIREVFEKRCAANDPNAYYHSFNTLMTWGMGERLHQIKHATIAIASDMDYTPVKDKQAWVDRMHQAELVVIKNSRHGVVMDQSEALNQVMLEFLSRNG